MAAVRYTASKLNEKKMETVAKGVLADVKPTKEERKLVVARINEIMGRLKKAAPKNVEIVVAGSFARETNLRGDSDVDIFLLFGKSVKKESMESIALGIAKNVVKGRKSESYMVKYAEHPYVRLMLKDTGMNVDVVPAYKIRSVEEMGTAVDRTQLHNEFVKSELSSKQRDDVLVLKSFLKSHNIYGADARTEGFSGYICELLVIHYGSFLKLLEAMANTNMTLTIRVGKKADAIESTVLKKRFGKNLVVIDPTDDNRNVAANVSDESFARLALVCRMLLSDPSKSTFYGSGHSENRSGDALSKLRKRIGVGIYAVCFKTDDKISGEIIWQQLKRLRIRLVDSLSKKGFASVLSVQEVEGSDAVIAIFANESVIHYKISKGPSALIGSATESFWKAHRKAAFFALDGDKIYAVENSELKNPLDVIKDDLGGHDSLPSYLSAKRMKIYHNDIPEVQAKMVYRAYSVKTSL